METCPECAAALTQDSDGVFCQTCGWDPEFADTPSRNDDYEPNDFDDKYYDDDDGWDDDPFTDSWSDDEY